MSGRPFHVMTKPVGAVCNLDCVYCYYLEKEALYPERKGMAFRMPDDVLEAYVRQYLESQPGPEVTFAWQGGEPTLLGVEFFERALELQEHYAQGRSVQNSLQTNGTLLDDRWGEFLARNRFLVGVSVDGPAQVHDKYRVDKGGGRTHAQVLRGIEVLKRHGVEFNLLTTLNANNVKRPLELYRYLRSLGTPYLQFIPVVERHSPTATIASRQSVPPAAFGDFLCAVFDEWVRQDVGRVFVQFFDSTLATWLTGRASMCVHSEVCGSGLAMEHNGDLYSCDHFVYPEFRLGNILELPMADMVASEGQQAFGLDKRDSLPRYCRECPVRSLCHGDCPKHRFAVTPDGEPGLSYLCPAYKRFFTHSAPAFRAMADLVRRGRPAADVMRAPSQRLS
jgi:uncharacterized protein